VIGIHQQHRHASRQAPGRLLLHSLRA
jgi:hypothetical protein